MSVMPNRFRIFAILFAVSMASVSVSGAAGPRDIGRSKGPPPEAIAACTELSQGGACSFTGRRNDEIEGTCNALPSADEELACVPDGAPPGQGRRPE